MSITEFELIQDYFARDGLSFFSPNVPLAIGDDCALLQFDADEQLVISIDTQVEGVHFPKDASPDLIAQRALRCALSDLAAMAAEPVAFTLAITLPEAKPEWLERFSLGLLEVAQYYQMPLIGGDTTKGPLTISIQVHGKVKVGRAVRRSGAQVGDLVCVTGCLGDAGAALSSINKEIQLEKSDESYLLDRFYKPEPRIALAKRIADKVTAMIDISDGVLADLAHIAKASRVSAAVELNQIPLSLVMQKAFSPEKQLQLASGFGDDYELCFTVSKRDVPLLQRIGEKLDVPITIIGEIVAQENSPLVVFQSGQQKINSKAGYSHF